MQHCIAMRLATLPPALHGWEQVQGKLFHLIRCLWWKLLNGMNQAVMFVVLQTALGLTMFLVQLMYTVSSIWFKGGIAVDNTNNFFFIACTLCSSFVSFLKTVKCYLHVCMTRAQPSVCSCSTTLSWMECYWQNHFLMGECYLSQLPVTLIIIQDFLLIIPLCARSKGLVSATCHLTSAHKAAYHRDLSLWSVTWPKVKIKIK